MYLGNNQYVMFFMSICLIGTKAHRNLNCKESFLIIIFENDKDNEIWDIVPIELHLE